MRIQSLNVQQIDNISYSGKNNPTSNTYNGIPIKQGKIKPSNSEYGRTQIMQKSAKNPSFGIVVVDDIIGFIAVMSTLIAAFGIDYLVGSIKEYRTKVDEQKRKEEQERIEARRKEDIKEISDSMKISVEKATSYLDKFLGIAGIKPTKDGNEKGMNAIRGYGVEKYELAMNVLTPIIAAQKIQDSKMQRVIPNGVILYGPPGSGKTYISGKLCEHLKEFGSEIKEIALTDNDHTENAKLIRKAFAEAEAHHKQTGKYTIINFVQDMDNYFIDREIDDANIQEVRVLMNCAENCASRGAVWIGTANRPRNIDPAIIRAGRADIKIPIGNMEKFAVADMIKYSLYRYDEKKSTDAFDYQKVVDTIENKDFTFTPSELDLLVKNAIKMKLGKEKPLTADMLINQMIALNKEGLQTLDDTAIKRFEASQRYMDSIDEQDTK